MPNVKKCMKSIVLYHRCLLLIISLLNINDLRETKGWESTTAYKSVAETKMRVKRGTYFSVVYSGRVDTKTTLSPFRSECLRIGFTFTL